MSKTVVVNADWKGGMRFDAQAQNHTIIIDQPSGMGGNDAGANPMEYLLVTLAGCLGTVAAIIANQERINLRGFSVHLEGDYDPEYLLGKTKEGRAGFKEIRVKANIDADMTAKEKEAFFKRVHSRCPATDNLKNNTNVKFEA